MTTNSDRATWAEKALKTFVNETNMKGEDNETIVSDFLADLMHYCDENDLDWAQCLDRGAGHYEEEVAEEE